MTAISDIETSRADLRWLVDAYYAVQKARIASTNRVGAVERQADTGPVPDVLAALGPRLQEIEDDLADAAGELLEAHPAWAWLGRVLGVGPRIGGKLLGLIGEIASFDTVSKLWRHAGYAVIDGRAERSVKGEKRHYDLRLKTASYLAVKSFVMLGDRSPYEAVYRSAKQRFDAKTAAGPCAAHPLKNGKWQKASYKCADCWTPLRAERSAYRVVAKLFLSHLWETWRKAEGLPVRPPYILEHGHTMYLDPERFAEPIES